MDEEQERSGGIRRWTKLAVIALAVAALITIVVMMIGGGGHGPARHFSVGIAGQGER